jgi:hypothetical protein
MKAARVDSPSCAALRLKIELINAGIQQSFALITKQWLIRLATALPREQGRGLRPSPISLQDFVENASAQAQLIRRFGDALCAESGLLG